MKNKEQLLYSIAQVKIDDHFVKVLFPSSGDIPLLPKKIILRSMKNSERRRRKKSIWGGRK